MASSTPFPVTLEVRGRTHDLFSDGSLLVDGQPTRHQWEGHEAFVLALTGHGIPHQHRKAVASALLLTDIRPMSCGSETDAWLRCVAHGLDVRCDDCDKSFNPAEKGARVSEGWCAWCPDCFARLWSVVGMPVPTNLSRNRIPQGLPADMLQKVEDKG